jgi:hypothetical protein
MAISILLVFSIHLTQAAELTLDSPDSVEINEEFKVSINLNLLESEEYDVKIFIHDSDDEKISREEYISEIYDGGWKDSYYYIKGSFPASKEYEIRATSSPGDRIICLRLRKSSSEDSGFEQICKPIEITASKESSKTKTEDSEEKSTASGSDEKQSLDQPQAIATTENQQFDSLTEERVSVNEKIVLNAKTENAKQTTETFSTKQDKIKRGIIYSFVIFCVVIITLLALKKL